MNSPRLSTVNLGCERGYRRLFSNINIQLHASEMLKITGFNGAGKSTLLKLLSGQNTDYEGEIFFNGKTLNTVRHEFAQSACFLGHHSGIKRDLTAAENLQFFSRLYPCKQSPSVHEALHMLNLGAFADVICSELSQGQQQRVAFARFLLSQATLWILDEPFTAIDRQGIGHIEKTMSDFLDCGGSIIMTSHHEVNIAHVKTLCLSGVN